jgi:diaminopimelate epimerase
MPRPFRKMHGLGNDFVVFDARVQPLALTAGQVVALADRHTGIGCDQLIVIEPSDVATAFMRIWNADGGEVEACGNAARCVATLLGGQGTIATAGGILDATATGTHASVTYPPPVFYWDKIPLAYPLDTADVPVAWDNLGHGSAVNVGNPHIVFFVADANAVDLATLGPLIEHDALFPERINVGVAHVVDRGHIVLRVWERGAGLTLACGTGAVAAAVTGVRRGLVDATVTVTLPGGDLGVAWYGAEATLTGPAVTSFTGTVAL